LIGDFARGLGTTTVKKNSGGEVTVSTETLGKEKNGGRLRVVAKPPVGPAFREEEGRSSRSDLKEKKTAKN